MSKQSVGRLYDALQSFESRRKAHGTYPVHKTLRRDDSQPGDIYDWIIERAEIPDSGSILDVGCGVGFGTLRLAERSRCRVTGISLSQNEIVSARAAAAGANLADRVDFKQTSFDDLPVASYDLAVAVESLKHSSNLTVSLRSVLQAIKPGGQLVVVEDLFTGSERAPIARRLAADWSLARLYAESEYIEALNGASCRTVDLTDSVAVSGNLSIAFRLALLSALIPFAPAATAGALRAFRGGLYLEKIYAQRAMRYKAIFCSNPP